MPPALSSRERFFRTVAMGSLAAATYHALVALGAVTGDGSPTWRHALFAGIDAVGAVLLVRRPRWLVFPVAVLAVQQFGSHGRRVVAWWAADRAIDWISIVLLLALTATVVLLWQERRLSA